MKYHNFFEKKEREYRNKILEYFGSKKIQNENKKEENEYNIIPNDENGENKDTEDNNQRNYHPNIIKITLWFGKIKRNLLKIKSFFLKVSQKVYILINFFDLFTNVKDDFMDTNFTLKIVLLFRKLVFLDIRLRKSN